MALIQKAGGNSPGGSSTIPATFGSPCTPGSTILAVFISEDGTVAQSSVADNGNAGNYTQDKIEDSTVATGTGTGHVGIYRKANTSSSAVTVTGTVGANINGGRLEIYEYSGTLTLDATGGTNDAVGSSPMSMSILTTAANCIAVCGALHYDNNAVTADSGFTQDHNAAGFSSFESVEHIDDIGSSGSHTLTFGASGNKVFVIAAASYTSGGGGSTSAALQIDGSATATLSTLTKKWRVPTDASDGVTLKIQVLSASTTLPTVTDGNAAVVASSGFFKFTCADQSVAVSTEKPCRCVDQDSNSAVDINGFNGFATVIEE